jgi:hypothetical protein
VHHFKCGDQVYFRGYTDLLDGMEAKLHPGDLAVVAAVDRDGDALTCFPIDTWGRVYSSQGETLFPEEVLLLSYAGRVPRKRLPRPFGDMDNQIDGLPVGIDCCGPSNN